VTNRGKVVFKDYTTKQMMLLPPSLEELIPAEHPVRVVDRVLDQINLDPLLKKYKGGGTSSYHPRMLLKVVIYGYLNNVYSSRRIEASVQENIHYMWLSGMSTPDHNTINRFRGERLKDVLKPIFKQIVLLLSEAGLVSLEKAFIDGTKIEANANRYTFVWGKSIKNSKERIVKQIDDLWNYAQQVAQGELEDTHCIDFQTIDSEKVNQAIAQIDKALADKPVDKKVKQKLNYAKKNWPANLDKYQLQEKAMGQRNSLSKTDTDATFMRMKDDHMKNGQLKPGYNLQISTNNQIITNYSLHHNPSDSNTLIPHLTQYQELYGKLPCDVVADSGYGSQENYQYLEDNDCQAYVKYNYFHQEQRSKKDDTFNSQTFHYNSATDQYFCPIGQPMDFVKNKTRKTSTGYDINLKTYQARNCNGCPLRAACHTQKTNRIIEVNPTLKKLKAQARNLLLSEEGVKNRKQRCADVESVFGNMKHNHGFTRFSMRGLLKVDIETGLMAIAHNLRKMVA
jgi:transposase